CQWRSSDQSLPLFLFVQPLDDKHLQQCLVASVLPLGQDPQSLENVCIETDRDWLTTLAPAALGVDVRAHLVGRGQLWVTIGPGTHLSQEPRPQRVSRPKLVLFVLRRELRNVFSLNGDVLRSSWHWFHLRRYRRRKIGSASRAVMTRIRGLVGCHMVLCDVLDVGVIPLEHYVDTIISTSARSPCRYPGVVDDNRP